MDSIKSKLEFVEEARCQSAAVSTGKGSGDYPSVQAFWDNLISYIKLEVGGM